MTTPEANKPLSSIPAQERPPAPFCSRQSCSNCETGGELTCRQDMGDVLDFMLPAALFFLPFFMGMITGGYWRSMLVWGILMAVYLIYFQARLVCCRCPHYSTKKRFLTCHAAWGLPKIPRYNPRPLQRPGRLFFLVYLSSLILYPFPFLVMSRQWLMMALAGLALVSWARFVYRRLCSHCVNLFCPFNRLPAHLRICLPTWRQPERVSSQEDFPMDRGAE